MEEEWRHKSRDELSSSKDSTHPQGGVINQTKNLEILHFPENCHTLKDIDIWIRVKAPNQGGVINQPKNLKIL